ncbi:MAG: PAS domain S-box protein, partial [Myxococcales bacterium]
VHPDDRPLLKELRKGGYRSEAPVVLRWLHVDGSVVWTEQSFLPVRDHDGTLLGVDALVRCIEPPTAVRAMSGSEAERLRLLLNEQQDFSVIMLEPDGTIATWNAAAERMSGFAAHEVMGRHLDVLHTPEDVLAGRPRKILEHARRTGRYSAQEWRPRKDGTRYWCDLVVTALHDEQGRLVGFGRLARDLTERLALEEQLRQAQKMESVGRLAAGVAHDFNNLLSVILTAAVIGRRECPEQSPARADFEEIENAARRAATLTRQLLIFSRRQVTDPVVLRLDELVAGMQGMITRLVGEDVEVRVRSSCASPLVRGDRGQLEQVVLNLVVNARDAMPEGGVLTLETRELRLDAGFAEAAGVAQPGDYVVLTVSDTGCGMPEPVKARLFEPFFTTKEQGRGTGLGLPTCMGIVKQCGGAISV